VVLGQPRREIGDLGGIGDVVLDAGHAGVGFGRLVQKRLTAAGEDDAVALGVQALRKAKADAGGGAGDEDGFGLHGRLLYWALLN
jgi:hypothetical protein